MIKLGRVRLINWYGFAQTTVPIGNFTLIAGRNGNGKSVFLDAVRYALYGDTVFNKSSEKSGSRTVLSYTRGLLDATAGTYMRPADKMSNVYTHIVLEMNEPEVGRVFLLGTVIETDAGNSFRTQRYVLENHSLTQVYHTYETEGRSIPYSASELQKVYGLKMMDVKDGLQKFMQRTGLRFNEQQLTIFRRKLRSILFYDPSARIDRFIRENVLEPRKVDFSKLVEARNSIDTLNANFERINNEIQELDDILGLFEELQRASNVLLADDVKISYRKLLDSQAVIVRAEADMEAAKRQTEADEKKLDAIAARDEELRSACHAARENLLAMDCAKAIADAEEALRKTTEVKERLRREKEELCAFQTRVSQMIVWLMKRQRQTENEKVLSALTEETFSKGRKESCVQGFAGTIQECRDDLIGQISSLQKDLKRNEREQDHCRRLIKDCDAHKMTFSSIPEYMALKEEINREFRRRGIHSEARFACEYVTQIRDESWRNALEAYLGRRRYTILVEPQYYDIADDVLNNSHNTTAHLFNTRLLMQKKLKPEPDSAVRFLEVKNPVAKQYFDFQLGRFHAVACDQVRNYENAISREGRISVAMDGFFLNFDVIRFYCLGQEAIELNRIRAEKKEKALQQEAHQLQEQHKTLKGDAAWLDQQLRFFDGYNYDACREYDEAQADFREREERLRSLREAQANNLEYMELVRQVEMLEQELQALERERRTVYDDKSAMQTLRLTSETDRKKAMGDRTEASETLNRYRAGNPSVCARAIRDYDAFVAGGKTGSGGTLKDRERAVRAQSEAGKNLRGGQAAYNASRQGEARLPVSDDSAAAYRERRNRIWMDDREEIQSRLWEQTRRYEEIFKNEFVLTVLKSCETARNDLKLINAELSRLNFTAKYSFEVKYVKDGSDYEKILEYARYLKEREELGTASGQMTLDALTVTSDKEGEALEQEIRKIINRIVKSNDRDKIEQYADYRNYMTYEILLTNDVLRKAKLSRQSGYNSGAEVQIPYLLILLSALLLIYNEKLNSTRLIFIDEPFAKMDPSNVRIMMRFMREQNLQMIFCAPDKTELIGNECNVILPVLRTRPNLMEIGEIEFHDKKAVE